MKKEIHPKYNENCTVTCACGNSFVTGSTLPEIKVELCKACHPFYTGKQKFVDTARRVEKFAERAGKKDAASAVRKGKAVKKAEVAKKRATKTKAEVKKVVSKKKAGKK